MQQQACKQKCTAFVLVSESVVVLCLGQQPHEHNMKHHEVRIKCAYTACQSSDRLDNWRSEVKVDCRQINNGNIDAKNSNHVHTAVCHFSLSVYSQPGIAVSCDTWQCAHSSSKHAEIILTASERSTKFSAHMSIGTGSFSTLPLPMMIQQPVVLVIWLMFFPLYPMSLPMLATYIQGKFEATLSQI